MNRKITILLSLLLVSVLLALPVFATTGSGSAAASAETVKVGDTVEVVFSIGGFERLNALAVSFTVPEGLKVEKAQWLIQGTISDININKGQAVWTKADPVDLTESTPVLQLTLKVLEPAAGTAELTYKISFRSDVKMDAAALGTVSAEASVKLNNGCVHTLKEIAAKTPDCQNTGNQLYYVCESCGKVFAADKATETTVQEQTLPVTDHSYEDAWTTDSKQHWHACKVCGAKADAADHKMKLVVDKYPTESAEGKQHQVCQTCAYETEAVAIGKLYHNPKLVVGKEPTCTEDGVIDHFYCGSCGSYYTSDNGKVGTKITKSDLAAKATGHTFADAWTNDGTAHWHECECGEISDKASHEYEVVGASEATEEETGYTGDEVCKVCQYVGKKGEEIPCLETEPVTEPTTVPTETQPAQPEEPVEEQKGNPVFWIIPLVIVVAGAIIAPIVVKRKRG